ncbi:MAG: fimbrillin family protein [Rikenellaceae bacterium]
MKKLTILLMGVAVAFSSCNKNEDIAASGSNAITFSTDEIRTRVANNVFEAGDVVTVQAFKDGAAYASADYSYAGNSNEFTSATPISYTSDEAIELSYQAVYPAVESFASEFTHAIATDQTEAEAYEASDLLVATVDATASLKPALNFVHTMSRVNLTMIVNRDGVASSTDAVSNVKINAAVEAACDITAGTYAASGDVVEITPAGADLAYTVLVAPQEIAADGFATATVGDSSFTMENVAATLVSGYVYELKWTIDLTTGTQSVEITGTIDEWTPGEWGNDDQTTDPDEPTVDPSEPISITLDGDTNGFPTSANSALQTIDVDGATFAYSNLYVNSSYNSFSTATGSGSIYNLTALEGLSKIVITEDYQYYNFTLYAGSEANPTSTAVDYVYNESDDTYTYTIPANCEFITIINESTYTATADAIDFYFESLGATSELPEIEESSSVTIYATDWGLSNAEDVPTTTLSGYTFAFIKDENSSNEAKYYDSDKTIRYYTNGTMTITATDNSTISSIVFDIDGSMTMTANCGTIDTSKKTWTGAATSVVFTATAKTVIKSITITK